MGITPQEWAEFLLILKAIGYTLFMLAYAFGFMACFAIFTVGAFQTANWLCAHTREKKG